MSVELNGKTYMTVGERIDRVIHPERYGGDRAHCNFYMSDDAPASVEKLIYAAYENGRYEATREVSDAYVEKLNDIRERAEACRYYKMARAVAGDCKYIYFPDYSGDYAIAFCEDPADI